MTLSKEELATQVELELADMLKSGKPIRVAAKLDSLPIPKHIDEHLRNEDNRYLWQLDPRPEYSVEMYAGVWLNSNLDYVHMMLLSKDVFDHYVLTKYPYPSDSTNS